MDSLLHLVRSCLPAAALLAASGCATGVVGDGDTGYGEVSLSVAGYDQRGVELSRDVRTAPGAELVEPLDRDLHDPITLDGDEESDPAGLFSALVVRVDGVSLTRGTRNDIHLRASGDSLLAVRSADRSGGALRVEVDSGWFEIALAGTVSADSTDRILATALVRIIRGEALLADDCRPDCLYEVGADSWLCAPVRDLLERELGECAGPLSAEERSAIADEVAAGKQGTCDGHGLVPRPLCEWAFDQALATGTCCAAP